MKTQVLPQSVSLALGGGGARGIVHVGVFRYLESHQTTITEISGTSAGAIVGAMIASGMSSDDMGDVLDKLNILKLADINLRTGFLKGEKLRAYFETLFGKTHIEDLHIPLTITATDINT
jgi:NTE family protein